MNEWFLASTIQNQIKNSGLNPLQSRGFDPLAIAQQIQQLHHIPNPRIDINCEEIFY